MNNLYLILGENQNLINLEIEKIIKKYQINSDSIIKYNNECNIDLVIEDLDTYSMFSNIKVVIISNPLFLINKTGKNSQGKTIIYDTSSLEKYIEHPSNNILIITTSNINMKLKISNLINKTFNIIKLDDINLQSYVKKLFTDYQISNQNISYLLNRVGSNINNIELEINKLKLFKLDELNISKEDIDIICNKNIDASIFDLIDSILTKNKKRSYELYNHFINYGTEIFQIMILLSNQIRLIYNVKVLQKYSDNEIADILGVKEYPVKLARKKGINYSKNELLNLLLNLAIIDEDVKSGKQLINISFLTFIMNI